MKTIIIDYVDPVDPVYPVYLPATPEQRESVQAMIEALERDLIQRLGVPKKIYEYTPPLTAAPVAMRLFIAKERKAGNFHFRLAPYDTLPK